MFVLLKGIQPKLEMLLSIHFYYSLRFQNSEHQEKKILKLKIFVFFINKFPLISLQNLEHQDRKMFEDVEWTQKDSHCSIRERPIHCLLCYKQNRQNMVYGNGSL